MSILLYTLFKKSLRELIQLLEEEFPQYEDAVISCVTHLRCIIYLYENNKINDQQLIERLEDMNKNITDYLNELNGSNTPTIIDFQPFLVDTITTLKRFLLSSS
jgi:hypothetical protein